MPLTGIFDSDSILLIDQPWFGDRWRLEQQVLEEDGPETVGFVEASDLKECDRFPDRAHLSFEVIMRSRRVPDQLYAAQIVLPANWPWGEPISYMIEPNIQYTTRVEGRQVPHIYAGGGFRDALCTHVAAWDTTAGRSTLASYLFVVGVWWACFEEFLRRKGDLDYHAWCRAADWLIKHWNDDWSQGIPTT